MKSTFLLAGDDICDHEASTWATSFLIDNIRPLEMDGIDVAVLKADVAVRRYEDAIWTWT